MSKIITNTSIFDLLKLITKQHTALSVSQLLCTILRRKGKENPEPYFWTDEQLLEQILKTKKELDDDAPLVLESPFDIISF